MSASGENRSSRSFQPAMRSSPPAMRCNPPRSTRAGPTKGRLVESLQAVERVLEQVRDLSLSLRPSMLDDLGLEAALRWYTNRQASLVGLQAEFRADALEDRLDPVIET